MDITESPESNAPLRISSNPVDESLGEWKHVTFPMVRRGQRVRCKGYQATVNNTVLTIVLGPFSQTFLYKSDLENGTYESLRLTPEMVMSLLDIKNGDTTFNSSVVPGGVVQKGNLEDIEEESRRRISGK